MGLTVNDALAIEAMKQAKVLAGRNGLDREIVWVTVIEVLDDIDGRLNEIVVNGRYYAKRLDQLKATPEPLELLEVRARELHIQLEDHTKAVTAAKLGAKE